VPWVAPKQASLACQQETGSDFLQNELLLDCCEGRTVTAFRCNRVAVIICVQLACYPQVGVSLRQVAAQQR
jgi:hypothetical protein